MNTVERAAEPGLPSEHEPEPAGDDVAERVYDRVSVVAVRDGPLSVAADDELRVLGHFPQGFHRDRDREPPESRQPRKEVGDVGDDAAPDEVKNTVIRATNGLSGGGLTTPSSAISLPRPRDSAG
jgi:hypothetical protein